MAWHCQEALSLSFNDRSLWELSGTFVILLCAEEREGTGKCTCGYCAVFMEMDNWLIAYYLCTPSWMHASCKRGSTIRSCLAVILPKCAFIMATLFGLLCLHSFNNRMITKWKSAPQACLPRRRPTALLSVPISSAVYAKVTHWINVSRSLSSSPCSIAS